MSSHLEEKDFRLLAKETQERIMRAFDQIDPDLAEADFSQGALTIKTPKGKIIISLQPPVRQIWMANATEGLAVHFDWDDATSQWVDDKGKGLELITLLRSQVKKASDIDVSIPE